MSVILHGSLPSSTAVLHGGPGGIGSCADLAAELAERTGFGVLECLQTRYSIAELLDELDGQFESLAHPITLIGHSWGAWLAVLYAVRRPESVGTLILIGCPPLVSGFDVDARRIARFTPEMHARYQTLLTRLKTAPAPQSEALLKELGALCEEADSYAPMKPAMRTGLFDGRMYQLVWGEAAELRKTGILSERVRALRVKPLLLHGNCDPHPLAGVTEPLTACGIPFEAHEFTRCGHTPWRETFAREEFYSILRKAIPRPAAF